MTDLLEDEFGDIIGKARFGLDLSADEVAGQVGISAADLQVLEDCLRSPTKAESDRLAALLDLDPERLLAVAQDAYVPDPVPLDHGGVTHPHHPLPADARHSVRGGRPCNRPGRGRGSRC